MSLYLDASATVPTLIEEGSSQAVDEFLAVASDPFVVSDFAAIEVASSLSRLVRMTTIRREVADTLVTSVNPLAFGSSIIWKTPPDSMKPCVTPLGSSYSPQITPALLIPRICVLSAAACGSLTSP